MNTSRLLSGLGIIVCLLLPSVIVLMPANTTQAQPADSAWPMFRQNPSRTGRSPYSGPGVPKPKWSFTTGSAIHSSPAIGADGTIYVGSDDDKLYAINPNGTQKWSFTTGAGIFPSPAIGADGTIYVGSYDDKLYAINPNGTQKWSLTTGDSVESSPAIGADGTIYVGSDDDKLYAINPNGTQKWSFTTGDCVDSCPAVGADGTIYVGSDDSKLYAINPSGTQKWSFTAGGEVFSSPAIGADGTIYTGSIDSKLYAITKEEYGLTISSSAGGSVGTPGEGTFTYDPGIGVNLVAEAEEGYRFVNWTGDTATIADVNAASTTITMNGDYAITANFMAQYDLSISSSAGGSVGTPGEGTFTYDPGIGVNLVAKAEEGYRFVNWTGDIATVANVSAASTTITMNGDYSISANFMAQCDLTISSTEGGSVSTPGIGSFTYDRGAVVNLVAEAEEGYRFVNWTGDVGAVANVDAAQTVITMNDEYSITANFERRVNWVLIGGIGGGLIIAGLVAFFVRRNKSARNK
jgi:hypothetical protein